MEWGEDGEKESSLPRSLHHILVHPPGPGPQAPQQSPQPAETEQRPRFFVSRHLPLPTPTILPPPPLEHSYPLNSLREPARGSRVVYAGESRHSSPSVKDDVIPSDEYLEEGQS